MATPDPTTDRDGTTRPSVLVLFGDQWRWDGLGSITDGVHTPVLDALADDGVHFDHFFVQSPVCMPSRASMLTGRYPSDLRITHMGVPVPPDTVTIATLAGAHGYRTASIGKLHFQPHANRDHGEPHPDFGFDTLDVAEEPGVYDDAYAAWVRARDPGLLARLGGDLPPAAATWRATMDGGDAAATRDPGRDDFASVEAFPGDQSLTHTAFVADRTMEVLSSYGSDEPFFCIAGFFSPHPPWVVPQAFLDLYDPNTMGLPNLSPADQQSQVDRGISDDHLRTLRAGYYAAISEVDHHAGRILDHLAGLGRLHDTIVVVVADHGEWLGDHLRFSKGHPGDDPVSRVPFLVRWPAGVHGPGRRVGHITEAVDLVPTLLEAMQIPTPPWLQGCSLLAALRDDGVARPASAVMEHEDWTALRTPTHRYVIHADGREELWDLRADPGEHDDVADQPDQAVALSAVRHELLQRLLAMRRPLPRSWPY